MKIGHEIFMNNESKCAEIGVEAFTSLPAHLSTTDCNIASFPFGMKKWRHGQGRSN